MAGLEAEATLRLLHAQLSRFDPDSDLSRLNRDPRAVVEITPAVAALIEAAIRAGRLTGGLVDATQLSSIESCGYATSRIGVEAASLSAALKLAPPRRAARPSPKAAWSELALDRARSTVERPTGMRIDSGGIAKGLAADLLAERLCNHSSFAIDCGGDLRIGGRAELPRQVEVNHPLLEGEIAARFELVEGAVATSGLRTRIWRRGDGYAHHLLDPSTGRPAWTGLVQTTAIAPTGVEAEARAKAALLGGPLGARRWLGRYGGVSIHDGGRVERIERPASGRIR